MNNFQAGFITKCAQLGLNENQIAFLVKVALNDREMAAVAGTEAGMLGIPALAGGINYLAHGSGPRAVGSGVGTIDGAALGAVGGGLGGAALGAIPGVAIGAMAGEPGQGAGIGAGIGAGLGGLAGLGYGGYKGYNWGDAAGMAVDEQMAKDQKAKAQ